MNRVLVIRPDNLGDMVLFTGAFRVLRQQWPHASIEVCAPAPSSELLSHCPFVDRLWGHDEMWRRWGVKDEQEEPVWELLRRIKVIMRRVRHGSFDLLLLPLRSPKKRDHLLVRDVPARQKIGVCGDLANLTEKNDREARAYYARQMDAARIPRNCHEIEFTRMFLEFVHPEMKKDALRPEFWTEGADRDRALQMLPQRGSAPVLAIAPGVSSPMGKALSAAWYGAVVAGVQREISAVVLLGTAKDAHLCIEVEEEIRSARCGVHIANLAGQTRVLTFVECIRECGMLLCPDAAAAHIGIALGKPTVCVVAGGQYGRFLPWGDAAKTRVLSKRMACYQCNWLCDKEFECVRGVQAEAAVNALKELLPVI